MKILCQVVIVLMCFSYYVGNASNRTSPHSWNTFMAIEIGGNIGNIHNAINEHRRISSGWLTENVMIDGYRLLYFSGNWMVEANESIVVVKDGNIVGIVVVMDKNAEMYAIMEEIMNRYYTYEVRSKERDIIEAYLIERNSAKRGMIAMLIDGRIRESQTIVARYFLANN